MALYKEHIKNKILDDLAGRNDNWEALETAINALNTELQTHEDKTANQGHTTKIKTITAASYTLLAEDNGAIIRMNSPSPQTVILPVGLDVGHETVFKQVGEGQTTLVAGDGATIEAFGGEVKSAGKNATFGVYIDAEDMFTPVGNLEAV